MKKSHLPFSPVVSVTKDEQRFLFERPVAFIKELCAAHLDAFNLHVGNLCNQSCVYCNINRYRGRFHPTSDLRRLITLASERGLGKLALIGGEPTIRKDLPELVTFARESGFAEIILMTNGLVLSYASVLDDLVDRGVTTLHLSLDDFDAETQQRLSRNPRTSPLVMAALDNLLARTDLALYLYLVITRWNIGHLPAYLERVTELSNRRGAPIPIIMTPMKPEGFGADNQRALLSSMSEAAAAVRDIIRRADGAGMQVSYRDIPPCLMRGYESFALDAYTRELRMDLQSGEVLPAIRDPKVGQGPDCQACTARTLCKGVYLRYAEAMGWDEFRPVRQRTRFEAAPPRASSAWYRGEAGRAVVPGRAVVIGGTGFVGAEVTRQLQMAGWHVTSLSRRAVSAEREVTGAAYRLGDRGDSGLVGELLASNPDLWVDMAMLRGEEAAALVQAWNPGLATRFVVAGAVAEYGKSGNPPPCFEETASLRPFDDYGRGKVDAYRTLLAARQERGLPLVWAVLSQCWGPGDHGDRDRRYTADILAGRPIVLAGDGAAPVADGFVRTVAEALLHMAGEHDLPLSRANIRGPETISQRHYVETAASALGRAATLLLVPWPVLRDLASDGSFTYPDLLASGDALPDGRLLEERGFFPSVSVLQGVRETASWHGRHGPPHDADDAPPREILERLSQRDDVEVVRFRPA